MHGAKLSFAIAGALSLAAACAGGSDAESSPTFGGDPGSGTSRGGTSPNLPPGEPVDQPEQEVDRAFRAPVVSGHWVWTANPSSDRVALIDASTFAVKTAFAGVGPTYLTALPDSEGGARALVINVGSEDATLFSATEAGELETVATFPVHPDANAWVVTSDARFAIAWTDASAVENADPSQGFQDISVIDLSSETPSSTRLSVGYRPQRVFVDAAGAYAYLATDAGIDVVALRTSDGPSVEREIALSDHPARDTARREVNVTPDGRFAFVKREGESFVTVVDVARGERKDVQLPGIVTDLDLTADAKLALAVVRERGLPQDGGGGEDAGGASSGGAGSDSGAQTASSLAVLLPVDGIFDAPDVFDTVELDEVFASVELGARGETALLFANGIKSSRLTLLDLTEASLGTHRTVDLKLPVFTAISSPDGAHAIALLQPGQGSQQPGAFAVVPVAKSLPSKIQGTRARTVPADGNPAAMVAIDDAHALVTVSDGNEIHVAYLVSMPELSVDTFSLASAPLPQASGLVPEANQAFVAQRHPEGRITFIDLASKEQHTLTGFELSAEVGK